MHTSHCGILLRDGDQPAAVGCNVAESVRGRLAIRDDFAVDAMPAGCRRSVGPTGAAPQPCLRRAASHGGPHEGDTVMTAMMNQWCLWNMQVFRWGLHRERRSGLFGTRFFYVRRNSSSTTTPVADSARSPRSWRSACEDCRSGDQGGQ